MDKTSQPKFEQLVDVFIRLGALLLVIYWCIKILSPFLVVLIWGGIIAVALEPLFARLSKFFRGRSVLASVTITLIILSLIVVPSWLIIDSLLQGIHYLKTSYEGGQSIIPPPGESTSTWPAFAQPLVTLWRDASTNMTLVMTQHTEQIKKVALWFFGAFSNFGQGLLQFVASIIIAGVLLVYTKSIGESSQKIFTKLAGEYGNDFAEVTVSTIRNVVKGILGVAVIQAGLAGIGFFMAGIPFAGFWTILALMFAIIQVGAGPVAIPIAIYAWNTCSTTTATILTIWLAITLVSDNVLKPLLLGRNAPAPMLVIFLGAIGGFITFGFIGLFLGAVVLTLGYKLFNAWIELPGSPLQEPEKENLL
ncbi:MAG: AI-2E family transporter [bacterium]|nr:AI-2E family transporter [bacterium]